MSLFTSDNLFEISQFFFCLFVSQESDIDGGSGVSPNYNLKYLFRTHQLILITMLQHGKCLYYHVELKGQAINCKVSLLLCKPCGTET